jgi:hypothetical protein
MKNIVLIAGLLYLLLNTVAGFILTDYDIFREVLVLLCILSTTAIIYILYLIKNAEGSRTLLTFVFSVTGVLKILISLMSPSSFHNNYNIIFILGLIIVDVIILLVKLYKKKLLSQ